MRGQLLVNNKHETYHLSNGNRIHVLDLWNLKHISYGIGKLKQPLKLRKKIY